MCVCVCSSGVRPVVQLEEDAQQAQAHAQPQPAHGRVPAVPQEVHQERLPQSAHGERARGDGELETLRLLLKIPTRRTGATLGTKAGLVTVHLGQRTPRPSRPYFSFFSLCFLRRPHVYTWCSGMFDIWTRQSKLQVHAARFQRLKVLKQAGRAAHGEPRHANPDQLPNVKQKFVFTRRS